MLGLIIRSVFLFIALNLVVRNDDTERDFGQIMWVAFFVGLIDLGLSLLMGSTLPALAIFVVAMYVIIASVFQIKTSQAIGVVALYIAMQVAVVLVFPDSDEEALGTATEAEETWDY